MKWIVLFVLLLVLPLPLFGYLDPGSGSMLFSALTGIVATLFFVIKGCFYKAADIPAKIMGLNKKKRLKYSIVIYSEGKQYRNVFLPLLEEFEKRKIECVYMTSKNDDLTIDDDFKFIKTKFIGEGNKALFVLNTLEADVLIMTTPGIDVLQIKRSKGVKHYIHISHSAGGCSGYATYGVDYYDAVFTGGSGDKKLIRELEQVRNLPKKQIVETGCAYLDILRKKRAALKKFDFGFAEKRTTLLVSPTWGAHGLLRKAGEKILTYLTNLNKFNIIVRPHPQSWISDRELMADLKSKFPDGDSFYWDVAADGLSAMAEADLMISDFSGIIFDFILLFEKPVLAFVEKYDKRGHDSMDLKEDPWNLQILKKAGFPIDFKEIENLDALIESKLSDQNFEKYLDMIHEGMDKFPNESGKRAVDAVLKIMSGETFED